MIGVVRCADDVKVGDRILSFEDDAAIFRDVIACDLMTLEARDYVHLVFPGGIHAHLVPEELVVLQQR